MSKRIIILGAFIIVIALLAWAAADSLVQKEKNLPVILPENEMKISVVASLFPWYDLAREIGGDRVEATLLLPPGVEAHAFEPTPNDMITIGQAKLFVYTGDYLEPWAGDLVTSLGKDAPTAVALGEGLATLADEDEKAGVDPHIWLDPIIMSQVAGRLAQELAAIDPENKAYYNSRWENYQARLEQLDSDYQKALSRCSQNDLIYAGHYTFGYLAHRYGLVLAAAQGFSPDAESSPSRLIELSNLLRSKQASYVFTEASDSRRLADAIAAEAGVKVLALNSAHNLSREDLRAGLTYEQIMRENLEKLKIGLKCR